MSYYLTKLTRDIWIFNQLSQNLGNHRKKCILDCGTITYLKERILQFLNSPKDNRLCFAIRRCGFESGTISIYYFWFVPIYLFVFFLNFVRKWIIICIWHTQCISNVISIHVFTRWVIRIFLSSSDFVFKVRFFKNSIRDIIRVASGLYHDQNLCLVGTNLVPKCLKWLSPDNKTRH